MTGRAQASDARRQAFAWALYDVGNSAFATTVMAGFFPVFFKLYWSKGTDPTESTFRLGLASSLASLLVALLAPVLGAHADASRGKKRWLGAFAALGALATLALAFVGMGDWPLAAGLFLAATLGFSASLVFYDALLVSVAEHAQRDRISALGYASGYLGGGLLFALNVLMFQKPELFGLADGSAGVRASFALAGLWWGAFTLPLLLRVREPGSVGGARGAGSALTRALRETRRTLGRLRSMPQVALFLGAYFLYIDGIDTIQRMAVDYGLSIGLPTSSLMIALLIVNLIGFPTTLLFGRIAGRIGNKPAILSGIATYCVITVLGYSMRTAADFYVLAILVGLVQGGVQAISRSFYSKLIPAQDAGEFFGFYNMLGRFSAVIGPVLMGTVGLITGSPRASILSIAVLLLAGGTLLWFVKDPDATASAPRR
jgi:MFS transporter, UMF1 family